MLVTRFKGLVNDSADYHSKEKLEPGHSLDLKY